MKSLVKIYIQDYRKIEEANKMPLQPNWDLDRKLEREYKTDLEGQAVADQAFKVFNKEGLTQQELLILGDYHAPSLSVGDVVEVYPLEPNSTLPPTAYLCDSIGWQTKSLKPLPKKEVYKENIKECPQDLGF